MRPFTGLLRRFTPAYLLAALAATAGTQMGLLGVAWVNGYFEDAVRDLGWSTLFYGAYSLAFTFALGLVGWAILHLLRLQGIAAYAACGAVLGLITGIFWFPDGFTNKNPFILAFSLAGVLAGIVFQAVYYRTE